MFPTSKNFTRHRLLKDTIQLVKSQRIFARKAGGSVKGRKQKVRALATVPSGFSKRQ